MNMRKECVMLGKIGGKMIKIDFILSFHLLLSLLAYKAMHTLNEFEKLMKLLPIEIGNKIFNYLMPSLGVHRNKMKHLMVEIGKIDYYSWKMSLERSEKAYWAAELRRYKLYVKFVNRYTNSD